MDLDGTGAATLFLLNPTGGVLGGDRLETRVELGAGSRVCLSTPSATRVYRSAGLPAVQRLTSRVGEGAAARVHARPRHSVAGRAPHPERRGRPGARGRRDPLRRVGGRAGGPRRGLALRPPRRRDVARDAEGLLFKEPLVLGGARGWGGLGGGRGHARTRRPSRASRPRIAGWTRSRPPSPASWPVGGRRPRCGVTPLGPRRSPRPRSSRPPPPLMQRAIARLGRLPCLALGLAAARLAQD